MPLKVVVFFGSAREGRLGFRLAKFVKEILTKKGFHVDLFDPVEMKFPILQKPFHAYQNPAQAPEWLRDARTKVASADGYVVVSAEYNHSIPPALSNLLDHFPILDYKHKPCSIVCYSYGQFGGVRASMQLRCLLGELGMVTPQFIFAVPSIHEAFTEEGEPLKKEMTTGGDKMVSELEWFITALKAKKESCGPPA